MRGRVKQALFIASATALFSVGAVSQAPEPSADTGAEKSQSPSKDAPGPKSLIGPEVVVGELRPPNSGTCSIPLLRGEPLADSNTPVVKPSGPEKIRELDPPAPPCDELNRPN